MLGAVNRRQLLLGLECHSEHRRAFAFAKNLWFLEVDSAADKTCILDVLTRHLNVRGIYLNFLCREKGYDNGRA